MSKRLATRLEKSLTRLAEPYAAFSSIDGRHPFQIAVPDGVVNYPVRRLNRGKVIYFNFALAREMGLLTSGHEDKMTPELSRNILDTFAIQIINEYDQENGVRINKDLRKEHPHMATRYLQLQHPDKRGRTSGDGRSIWNGTLTHKGQTWDISSRGTGVTCLAPGAVQASRHLKTGSHEFGYGCGLADLSEVLGSAVLSEIFHLNGIGTERVLTVIDLGRGCGIGVRANPNLIRPAHLFLYLKQGRLDCLRQATDYFIRRQTDNGAWKIAPHSPDRYRKMLNEVSAGFARFAARLEREYVFAWMEWDGDNVLANGGIIDYGSIRQFGLRHDQYRYDDVERLSTTLNEQRGKARTMVQVFAQATGFLETGKRRSIEEFANSAAVREFDRVFDRSLRETFLAQVGFSAAQSAKMLDEQPRLCEDFYRSFLKLEKSKTQAGRKRVPDGFNRPAVFNMRNALRELPGIFARESNAWNESLPLQAGEFLDLVTSSFAKRADCRLKGQLQRRIERFLGHYHRVLQKACGAGDRVLFLKNLTATAEERNRAGRLTGNGAEYVVEELLKAWRKGYTQDELQNAIDLFVASQVPKSSLGGRRTKPANLQSNAGQLFQELVAIAIEYQEDL